MEILYRMVGVNVNRDTGPPACIRCAERLLSSARSHGKARGRWRWHDRFTHAGARPAPGRIRADPAYSLVTSFQCPSEMTSTVPSTTCMAV